jgi:hypothetical protein
MLLAVVPPSDIALVAVLQSTISIPVPTLKLPIKSKSSAEIVNCVLVVVKILVDAIVKVLELPVSNVDKAFVVIPSLNMIPAAAFTMSLALEWNVDAVVAKVTVRAARVACNVNVATVSVLLSVIPDTVIDPDCVLPIVKPPVVVIFPSSASLIAILKGVAPRPMVCDATDPYIFTTAVPAVNDPKRSTSYAVMVTALLLLVNILLACIVNTPALAAAALLSESLLITIAPVPVDVKEPWILIPFVANNISAAKA